MLVLFSIALLCFFALFGMMIILLRQAKAEGVRVRSQRERKGSRTNESDRAPDEAISPGLSRTGFDLGLSNLVPLKQPDWRFMVRENSQINQSGRKGPTSFRYDVNRPDRALSREDHGDLTDPASSNFARRA